MLKNNNWETNFSSIKRERWRILVGEDRADEFFESDHLLESMLFLEKEDKKHDGTLRGVPV